MMAILIGREWYVIAPSSHEKDLLTSFKMNARGGHFIKEDLACFDAAFFSVAPNEAKSLDPQQRWLLETTYEALENGRSKFWK